MNIENLIMTCYHEGLGITLSTKYSVENAMEYDTDIPLVKGGLFSDEMEAVLKDFKKLNIDEFWLHCTSTALLPMIQQITKEYPTIKTGILTNKRTHEQEFCLKFIKE